MDKYIGFDIDSKKTIACVVQNGEKDRFARIDSDIESMKKYLKDEREDGSKIHLTFEISGQAATCMTHSSVMPTRLLSTIRLR